MQEFGLIGKSLSHSFSQKYFEEKFLKEKINYCRYHLFPLSTIHELQDLIQNNNHLLGLNVTIPYKELVLPFLDEIDPIAKAVGAVNTIKINRKNDETKLIGFNTDVIGFRQSLKPFLAKEHHRALIFGTGGASKAVAFVLKQLNIPYYKVSRKTSNQLQTITYDDIDAKAIESFPLLINTTPLGMYPEIDKLPPIKIAGIGKNHLVYDLIYNPTESLLLKKAKENGALCVNGLSMLKLQAEAAWEIWKDEDEKV